ncbi:hypothetical protein BDZ45DRAFT_457977 [Acephala macrosclerotiorum]|nr:hypothetical protein BDZ45DRAFT_457977 [Acephala macrosclerotiorum]
MESSFRIIPAAVPPGDQQQATLEQAKARTRRAKVALDLTEAEYRAAKAAEEAMVTVCCDYCREAFNSVADRDIHFRKTCWTVDHASKFPQEWTPDLYEYVRRSFDPRNARRDWSTEQLQEQLECLIELNNAATPRIRDWNSLDLPQYIDFSALPYHQK